MIELDARLLWDILSTTLAAAAAAYAFFMGRNRANANEIVELDNRTTKLEVRMGSMPDHNDLKRLSVEVTELGGEIKLVGKSIEGLTQLLPSMQSSLDRVNDYLLNHKS